MVGCNDKHNQENDTWLFVTHRPFIDFEFDFDNNATMSDLAYIDVDSRSFWVNRIQEYSIMLQKYNYEKQVAFCTILRDPIKRIESRYYYLRGFSGGRRSNGIKLLLNVSNLQLFETNMSANINHTLLNSIITNYDRTTAEYASSKALLLTEFMSYKQCIRNMTDINICSLSSNYITRYFCGINEKNGVCDPFDLNKKSYVNALHNLNKYFSFVGLLNQWNATIKLLYVKFEKLLIKNGKTTSMNDFVEKAIQLNTKLTQRQQYGVFKRPKLLKNDSLYQYLESRNKLDIMLFDYVNNAYQQSIIPRLSLIS